MGKINNPGSGDASAVNRNSCALQGCHELDEFHHFLEILNYCIGCAVGFDSTAEIYSLIGFTPAILL